MQIVPNKTIYFGKSYYTFLPGVDKNTHCQVRASTDMAEVLENVAEEWQITKNISFLLLIIL